MFYSNEKGAKVKGDEIRPLQTFFRLIINQQGFSSFARHQFCHRRLREFTAETNESVVVDYFRRKQRLNSAACQFLC